MELAGMNKRYFELWIFIFVLVEATIQILIPACCASDSKPANIVLIMADDLGRECLQSYGGTSYQTPNLNRLAQEGIQFENCYSTPICTTSRVQIMTGKYNYRNYESFAYLNPGERTFGHLLKDAGYQTMIAGKWQLNGHNAKPRKLNWDDQTRPGKAGFDEYHLWQVHERKRERYWGADLVINGKVERKAEQVYSPDYFADQICEFMERNRDQPFFVYYPMLLTHAPFIKTPDSPAGRSDRQRYFADMVSYTDKIIGKIDSKISSLGLASETLIIFTGDNGTDRSLESKMSGRVVKGGKALTKNDGIHVPMICKWSGKIEPGTRSQTIVDFTDFYISFAELSGATNVGETDGISFLPALTNTPGQRREFSICHYDCRWGRFPATQFAYDQRFKVYRDGRVFRTQDDPLEENPLPLSNLSENDTAKVQTLLSALERLPKLKVESLIPGPRKSHGKERPNIILMMADDLGWGDVGFNGNEVIRTPNLDQMSASGMKFERFYAQSAVCSPTRGSCLTGRHPFRYGIFGANVGHLKSNETTLAELLKRKGYQTGHFGKWHLGTLDREFSGKGANRQPARNFMPPSDAGFDRWFSTEYAVATWDPYDPANAHSKKHAGDPRVLYWEDGTNVIDKLEGDDSRIIVDRLIPFIQSAKQSQKPFFAVVWFHAPHKPVVAGPEYRRMYQQYPEPAQHYYGCITAMDDQIGRIRQFLQKNELSENTMLCFCSDNGPEGKKVGEGTSWGTTGGLRGRKRSLYEGGIRVPGVIEWPSRIPQASKTNVPCSTSDYFPTIAEIVGCDADEVENCDGMSLVRIFDGLKKRHKPIGFMDRKRLVWMENRYKLIVPRDSEVELYDLAKDPGEQNNIAKMNSELTQSLRQRLDKWKESVLRTSAGDTGKF